MKTLMNKVMCIHGSDPVIVDGTGTERCLDGWVTADAFGGTTIFDVCAFRREEVENEAKRLCDEARYANRTPVELVKRWKKDYRKRFTKAGKLRKGVYAIALSFCRFIVLRYVAAVMIESDAAF
jgi:hypothetical protein